MSPASALPRFWQESYGELCKLARSRLRLSGPLTLLDTTGLVNQSYLRLLESGRLQLEGMERKQFFCYASNVMRSVIVDLARERAADKRGGGAKTRLDTSVLDAMTADDDPIQVSEALDALHQQEPRLAQIVEMRFFAGLSEQEIAEHLDLSERTVRREWQKARVLLRMMLS